MATLPVGADNVEARCDECKNWSMTCFACRFEVLLQARHATIPIELPIERAQLDNIASLEFLVSNPISIRQPQLDFTFRETQRTPNAPRQNEPLAREIMRFGDSLLQHSKPLALDVYMEAMYRHQGLTPLNARVTFLLVHLQRDVEALSFIASILQWPTMRFNQEIWLACQDSVLDELLGDVTGLHLSILLSLSIVKARALAGLKDDHTRLDLFLTTDNGAHLEQVQSLLADCLGGSELIHSQQQLMNILLEQIDERSGDFTLRATLGGIVNLDNERTRALEQELMDGDSPCGELLIFDILRESVCENPSTRKVFISEVS